MTAKSGLRVWLETIGFVAAWMAIGFGLRGWGLDNNDLANLYLLLGIPLGLVFQRFISRRRLREVWVRNADRFKLTFSSMGVAIGFAIFPVWQLVTKVPKVSGLKGSILAAYYGVSVIGAMGVAFSWQNTTRDGLRRGMGPFLLAVWFGMLAPLLMAIAKKHAVVPMDFKGLGFLAEQFLMYITVCFVLEEVVFRGVLDTHLNQATPDMQRRWSTALGVSLLWGLWHAPLLSFPSAAATAVLVPLICTVHILVGVPLAFAWRWSGTLLLPAVAHSLIDAYRNFVLR